MTEEQDLSVGFTRRRGSAATCTADYNQTAKGGEHLSFRCGVALETQHAPDSPNKPKWPTTIVKVGQLYRTTTEFRFGVV